MDHACRQHQKRRNAGDRDCGPPPLGCYDYRRWYRRWLLLNQGDGVVEFRSVRPGGQIDFDPASDTFGGHIKLRQPFANLAGAHPHNRIFAQFRLRLSAEDVDGNGPLLQASGFPCQRLLAHILQELLAALAPMKSRTGQNGTKLTLDLFRLG